MKNLMCVKSIVTIVLTVALVAAVFMYPDTYDETFKNAVTMVVTFYFAHQQEKLDLERLKAEREDMKSEQSECSSV